MDLGIQGKIALVTGASRGLGATIANSLAAEGVTVIGTATTSNGAEGITQRLQSLNNLGCGLVMNVREAGSIESALQTIADRYGGPLILVNNAGVTADNLLLRMNEDDWHQVLETNLSSLYRVTKPCLRAMIKARWGRIINIGSVVSATGNAGQVNYCAAKAGVEGFTKSLARELSSRQITVNCIAPGMILTDMTTQLSAEQQISIQQAVPLGRMGESQDIANTVLFLASGAAQYITGITLPVNGGLYMG